MTVSREAAANIRIWAISMTNLRSQMSATAPDASDSSMIGAEVDACTNATMSAVGAMEVISHEAPTAWIRPPKFEIRLALQIIAKMREWKGARVGESRQDSGSNAKKRERAVTRMGTSVVFGG